MATITTSVELDWGQASLVTQTVETPWGQATVVVSLGNVFTPGDGTGTTPTTPPSLDPIYTLPAQTVYPVTHTLTATDLRDNSTVPLEDFSMSCDDGTMCWTLQANVPISLFASLTAPGDPPIFEIVLDGIAWNFIIEGINRSRQFPGGSLAITGRSITITSGAPYEFSQNWTNDGPSTVAQICDQAQAFNGTEVRWLADDWPVPDRVWTFEGTPLEVVQRVASSIDAVVSSDRTENRLYVNPRYHELPNEWPYVAPTVEIHIDAAMVDSWQRADKPAYNAIYVSGQQQGSLAFVHLSGTAGDKLAPLVTELLLVDIDGCRQRGIAELGKGGPGALVQMTLPILTGGTYPGVIDLGWLCRVIEGDTKLWGVVRAVNVQCSFPSATQTITLEVHTGAIAGTVVELEAA